MIDSIHQKKVLAVEGKDEINFFSALLKYMEITDFEVREVGGKKQFSNKLPALVRMSGFSDIETLAIIQDADVNAEAAFESIRNILKKESLKPPNQVYQFSNGTPKIGIFIMPGNSDAGMLEDLCLNTVKDHSAMACTESFIDCVSKLEKPPKNIAKAKAQAFLAAMPEIANSVGVGAQKGYWDFNSEELTDLKSFIENSKQKQ
ncbi:MAG: hypothetical protein GWP12_03340 [Nitrospirae bacterium]|nr:hypothetical protein [Nitrospirota bacterium]